VVYQLETYRVMLYFHGKTAIFANLKFPQSARFSSIHTKKRALHGNLAVNRPHKSERP